MAFILRVFNPTGSTPLTEMFIESGNINRSLDSSSTFTITVPSNTVAIANLTEGLQVELYLNGTFLLAGEIQKLDRGIVDTSKSVSISGRDILDTLYDINPDPTLIIDAKPMLQAIHEILEPNQWRLGDISTLPDKEFIIKTVDLRNVSSYMEQIRKILDLQEGVSWKSGAPVLGDNTIDIGTFDEDSGAKFRSPAGRFYTKLPRHFNIISKLREKASNEEVVYYLEPVGGEVKDSLGVRRSITLQDAWENDNTLAYDPEFPIIEIIPGQRYAVINLDEAPYPGGLFYTVSAGNPLNLILMGDSAAGATTFWTGISFRGVPGRLNYISFVLIGIIGSFYTAWSGQPISIWVSELGTPSSYTYDHYNAPARLFEGSLPGHEDGLPPFGEYRIDLSQLGINLDYNKVYGFAIGFDNAFDNAAYIEHQRLTGSGTAM